MATLHLVNRSTPDGAVARCLAALREHDTVLFYENGVWACCVGALDGRDAVATVRFVALRADVDAHGVRDRLDCSIEVVDDADFVELVATHNPIVSWT